MGADEKMSGAIMNKLADEAYKVVDSGFGRGDEMESDEKGIALANTVGYAPTGMNGFLNMLVARNKQANNTERSGLFASHPETQERVDKMTKLIASAKLASTATVEARYASSIPYKPVPVSEMATIEAGSAGAAGATKPAEEPKKKGIGGLRSALTPGGGEKKSAQVTGSGAARGAGQESAAKGGSNPALVAVSVSAADIAAFKKAGGLK